MRPSSYLKKGWCRGAFARTEEGQPCSVMSDNAVAWCAEGAIAAAYEFQGIHYHEMDQMFFHLGQKIGGKILVWNDLPEQTRHHVIATMEAVELEVLGAAK